MDSERDPPTPCRPPPPPSRRCAPWLQNGSITCASALSVRAKTSLDSCSTLVSRARVDSSSRSTSMWAMRDSLPRGLDGVAADDGVACGCSSIGIQRLRFGVCGLRFRVQGMRVHDQGIRGHGFTIKGFEVMGSENHRLGDCLSSTPDPQFVPSSVSNSICILIAL